MLKCIRLSPSPRTAMIGSMKKDSLNKTPGKRKLSESNGKLSDSVGKLSEPADSLKNRARTGSGNDAKTLEILTNGRQQGGAFGAAPKGAALHAAPLGVLVVFHLVRISYVFPSFPEPLLACGLCEFADSESSPANSESFPADSESFLSQ